MSKLVTIDELGQTSLYPEIINAICRNDASACELQILAAESLCKSYLFKYDLAAAFGTDDTEPTADSPLLKKIVKMIASYFLVRMANPNIDIELFRQDYQTALELLADIRDGKNNIELPYAADGETGEDVSAGVSWSSNIKRTNHF